MTPIAIVGMGCRFGGAPDLQSFWQLSLEGRHDFKETPPDRWDHQAIFDTSKRVADKSYAPTGAWIDDIRSFPALALGIPPRRVEVMDPQQRLSLEMALQAIEDAGTTPDALPRRTGVFMGVTANEFRVLQASRVAVGLMASGQLGTPPEDPSVLARAVDRMVPPRPFTAAGTLSNMIAATVAQELDLHGPAYSLDAACASALMALHDAVAQLRVGSIDAALAGGVYLCLTPEHHIAFSRIGAISASGVCRPFDHRADGFVQGDGGGMVLLKRLEDARRDGDRVYAVIDGIAINNDGRGDGPMAPVLSGQREVIEQAWEDAGTDPKRLGYIEAHGTGTSVGDLTELAGLNEALGEGVDQAVIGSSKANVGHTMSAAGITGLIRAALSIYHQTLAPMANFEAAKDEVRLDQTPFRILTRAEPWLGDRVACVSSFGFGGTNGHAVLSGVEQDLAEDSQDELVLISAADPAALRDLAERTAATLRSDPKISVAGLARAWSQRPAQKSRLGLVAADRDTLISRLEAVARGENTAGAYVGEAHEDVKLCFLYPGQGSQRIGMLGDSLRRFPILQESLAGLEGELAECLDVPLSELLFPTNEVDLESAEQRLTATENCQPALLSCSLALTELLKRVGVEPHVVVGHSLGEFTAAAAGGVLSGGDAARFVARRGRAMADLVGDHGAMAAVMADATTAAELLSEGVVLANHNHPRQVVVSGTTAAVEGLITRAREAGVKAKRLAVSHAFHSPVLDALDASSLVDQLSLSDPERIVASGIAERPYATAQDAREVFLRHATSPVQFVRALEQCREAGANLYLQVGAGGPLAAFARGALPRDHLGILSLSGTDDHDGGRTILETLAQLWIRGVPVQANPITAVASLASAPPTVLAKEMYWPVKEEPQGAMRLTSGSSARTAQRADQPGPTHEDASVPTGLDDIETRVLGVVSRVSAYPLTALRTEMTLADDLGFDSLMVGDLATGLAEAFPGLGGIPQELLINRPTVQDLIDFARTGGQQAVDVDDDAPLRSYESVMVPAPLPRERREVGVVTLTGDLELARSLAPSLSGARVLSAAEITEAEVIVWCASRNEVPVSAVLAGEAEVPDPAGVLIDTLGQLAQNPPDVFLVHSADDPWSEALCGVVRGIGREWPGRVGKCIAAEAPFDLGAEIASADLSTDVLYTPQGRFVRGFSAVSVEPEDLPDGAVLITGGTRGIGLKLARTLAGRRPLLLVGRSAPADQTLIEAGHAVHIQADVTDLDALCRALGKQRIGTVIHAAGVLADGPLGQVDPAKGRQARAVKVKGFVNAIRAAGAHLKLALGIGSWAGRFGSRHQAHYAAANAQLAGMAAHGPPGIRLVVSEFGPWTTSEMVQTIPVPVQQAMRSEGVDFVGDEAGVEALLADLGGRRGISVRGRRLPQVDKHVRLHAVLSLDSDPYLADHAIQGTPVLPLAAAADWIAHAAGLAPPFIIEDLRLFQGVTVEQSTPITVVIRGERAELRVGQKEALAYRATIRPLAELPADPGPHTGGEVPLDLQEFYETITFHGPLLQGITKFSGHGDDFISGIVRTGAPRDWSPATERTRFAVDPLALDSTMQLSGAAAWIRYQRAGTPVGIGRLLQLRDWPEGELSAEVVFGENTGDRFSGTLYLRDAEGQLILIAEDTVAELRQVDAADEPFEVKPEWVDPTKWPALQEIANRLEAAELMGVRNPYFTVHQGTARDTTVVEDRELVNFSSYNYVGLSGDPRVLAQVRDAVDRYGTSVSASRVASGERPFHGELESLLAECQGVEDALVFTAGHATNVTTIGHLFGPDDLILHDELIHDSAIQGIKLSGAARRGFNHDDPQHLERQLKELRRHYQKVLIVVEGVYSMDGDICDLPAYIALKKTYGCMLMVDEAHSFGIIGKRGCGIGEHYGINPHDVDLWMGTLSKSLASCGGWISGSKPLITYLRYTAPGFVYSAGITAANGVAALASLRLMLEEPERVVKLQENASFFHAELVRHGLDTGPAHGESAVVPVVTGNSMHALMLSQRLLDQGINVQPIVYPAVADESARLRFFLSSTHSREQLQWTAERVADALASVRRDFQIPS